MRVLLVEDNDGDAELVRDVLTEPGNGVELVHVERLSIAADRLARERFDVILLDLSLPDAQGLEGLHALRAAAPSAPIVVLTGLVDEASNRRAIADGAQDYLQKGALANAGLLRAIRYSQERQQHIERARLLAQIGAALGKSLDPAMMISGLLDVVHRDYATWCGLDGSVEVADAFDETRASQAGHGLATLYAELGDASKDGVDATRNAELRARGMGSAIVVRFDANGRTAGTLVFAREAARLAFGQADQDVAEEVTVRLTAALEHAGLLAVARRERERAQVAGQLRDDFLATLSHELRTPLGAILGWTQMLRAGGMSVEKQAKALETIERNTLSQAALIEDVLDISRIIAGKMRLELRPVNLVAVVATALETVRPAADVRGVLLAIDATADVDIIQGDPDRLQQVLWNLLTNAVKFTPRDGRVTVRVRREHAQIVVDVSDTGQGIAPEFLPHVFERFRQADSSKKRAHSGLGLGLSISAQLVQMQGGTIHADSAGAGAGSTFTIRLPISGLGETATAVLAPSKVIAPTAAPGADLTGVTLVVVDDDPDTLEMLRSLFEDAGAAVTTAVSAEDGWTALTARAPHVLVSDVGMPGATGHDLIRRVRALPSERGGKVPAIALTAYARSEDAAEALRAGFDHHVAKPVQPRQLVTLVAGLAAPRTKIAG